MAGNIGIKEANGDFYSILEENSAVKKRLILTTVHDNQKSVQIDLFKSITKTMADAVYIGTIVVESISPKPKGEPSIEMILSSSNDGSITANAVDLGNPSNEQQLSVSLKSLEEDKNDYPDFEVENKKYESGNEKYGFGRNKFDNKTRKFPVLALIIIGLILALLCLGLWFFLFRNQGAKIKNEVSSSNQTKSLEVVSEPKTEPARKSVPPETVSMETSAPQKPSVSKETAAQKSHSLPEPAKPVVVEKAPAINPQAADRERDEPPVYSFNVPQTIPPEGIAYKIRWGDTLWDISEAFYRNPQLYTFIVRSNNLNDPNLIVSGTELVILPRN